jgi:hypothetical protein
MITHHATVIAATSLEAAVEQLPVQVTDIDTDVLTEPSLSIASVRSLIARAQQRPVRSSVRSFVVVANQIPVIAQNALLKLFEDPPTHTQFVVVMPRPGELIPTLRSRVQIIEEHGAVVEAPMFDLVQFQSEPIAHQLQTIDQWVKAGDQATIDNFLTSIEYYFATNQQYIATVTLTTYLSVGQKLRQPGASKKMLLEHLVLSLEAN